MEGSEGDCQAAVLRRSWELTKAEVLRQEHAWRVPAGG